MTIKAIKGNLISAEIPTKLTVLEQGYLVYDGQNILGTYSVLPDEYAHCEVTDYGDSLILPAPVDLHLHAPQFAIRGMGMDMELLDWLNHYTFPEEAKFHDVTYAKQIYSAFAQTLRDVGTTRAVIFASIHLPATYILMEELEKQGLTAYVGKVNMDRNSPDFLIEETSQSLSDTDSYIHYTLEHFKHIKPILTPRFVPSCTNELLSGLGELSKKYNLPVQSHLSENRSEVAWVQELQPDSRNYADAYQRFGLFGSDSPCIMAHCIHLNDEELKLMAKNHVYAAHCPDSNNNLSSGISPVRRLLDYGIPVGIGSDIGGGSQVSIFRVMAEAIQMSKLHWFFSGQKESPLSVSEAFYLGTSGGAAFFGDAPGFASGNPLHAVVMDDQSVATAGKSIPERLERMIYLSNERNIIARYADGKII